VWHLYYPSLSPVPEEQGNKCTNMYILDFALIHVDIQRGCNVDSVTSLKPPTINAESPDTYCSIINSIIYVDVT